MISKSFVMRCLNTGGAAYCRKSRSSASQPNQTNSLPRHSSAVNEGKVATPRQAARARLESRAYLDQGSKISGKLYFEGPAEIDGQIDGEIVAQDDLLIGEGAVVTAQIRAASIVIAGEVNGEIVATQRIELGPFAKVLGKLTAPHLVVHKGAMFEGRCTMRSERSCEDRKLEDRKVIVFPTDEHAAAHPFGFIWISRLNEMPRRFGESNKS
jgi:cytoskeletal protein CcmA (bactofilin family)